TDGVAGRSHLLENARLVGRVEADREEDRLGAMGGKSGQHRWGIFWPGIVVEGEYDLALTQEIVLLEVLKPELRAAGRVDLDHARNAQSVGISDAGRCRGRWARGRG